MQSLLIEGRAIEYSLTGPTDGPALVFSNSLGTDLRVWEPLLPYLPEGLRLLRYSKAGHGLSDFAGERPIEAHAQDLLHLLDHFDIRRTAVVGLSVGGLIAQALSAAAADRVAGLIFCCTAQRIGTPELWNQRIAAVRSQGLAAIADGVIERWFSPDFREQQPAYLALWYNMLLRTPAESYASLCAAIRDADFTAAVKAISVPTLCVAGTSDGSTPPDVVRGLADLIPSARFASIEGSGHIPCVQKPKELGALIGQFLKEYRLG